MSNVNGNTPWGGYPSIEAMGGGPEKRNYLDAPVNPETDIGVEDYNLLAQCAAGSAAVAPFAVLGVTLGASPAVDIYRAQHGMGPGQAPTVTVTGTGVYRVAWSASYADGFARTEAINLKEFQATPEGPGLSHARCLRINASTVDVYVFDSSGSLTATDTRITLQAWSGN